MIHKKSVEKALSLNIAQSDEMTAAIKLWADMYADCPPWKSEYVHSLNIPAIIASKTAKAVTLEAKITVDGSVRADYINAQLKPTFDNIRQLTELMAAKGGMIFKPYIDDGDVIVDCIHAGAFFPTSYNSNGDIIGGVFIAQKTIGKTIYTRLEQHRFTDEICTITNKAYRSERIGELGVQCSLSAIDEWKSLQDKTTIHNLKKPLFAYLKMPLANNIESNSPLGVSIYSRAAETIEQLDKQYSRLLWEFEGGELAIHANEDLFLPKVDGRKGEKELPNGNKRLYRIVDGEIKGRNFFEVFSPTLRDISFLNGFNVLLKQIETQCGFAFGMLSDPQSVDKTATEVMQSKQEFYSTVVDIQKALEKAIDSLAYSIDALATAARLAPSGSYHIAYCWDDSIVVDKEQKKALFWQYVTAGKFPMWKYLVEFDGYTEEEAKKLSSEEKGPNNPFDFEDGA